MSSIKVKYITIIKSIEGAIWIKQLLQDIEQIESTTTIFNCDDQSCILPSHDHKFHACKNHIEIQYYYMYA
jgi:hypothetical protein